MDLLRDTDRVEIEYEYNGVITTFYPDVEPKARHAKPRPEPRRKLGGQIVNLDGTPTGKFWNGRQGNFNSHYKVKKSELPGAIDESPRPPRFRFYQEVNEGLGSCLVKEYASPVPAWEAAGGVVTPVAEGAGVTSWRMPAPKIVYGRHLHRLVDEAMQLVQLEARAIPLPEHHPPA
jgi:hypothetical protein